jgi:hypothetical protein
VINRKTARQRASSASSSSARPIRSRRDFSSAQMIKTSPFHALVIFRPYYHLAASTPRERSEMPSRFTQARGTFHSLERVPVDRTDGADIDPATLKLLDDELKRHKDELRLIPPGKQWLIIEACERYNKRVNAIFHAAKEGPPVH